MARARQIRMKMRDMQNNMYVMLHDICCGTDAGMRRRNPFVMQATIIIFEGFTRTCLT